jgi:hypothetical protein
LSYTYFLISSLSFSSLAASRVFFLDVTLSGPSDAQENENVAQWGRKRAAGANIATIYEACTEERWLSCGAGDMMASTVAVGDF